MPASPKNSMIQTSKKLRTETFFHLSRRFQSLARTAASASDQQNSSRASNVSRSTAKTYSKTTTFISQVVFFTFKCSCFLFLLNFIFQFHRLSFLYCPNFWRFARIFSRLGGLPPPPARTPMFTASLALNSRVGDASRAETKLVILLRLNMAAE